MEVEDRPLGEERGDLRREPARARRLLDDDAAAGSPHRGEHRLLVERLEGAQVEHLDRRLAGERVGGALADGDHRAPGDERRVRPLARDARAAELHDVVALGDRPACGAVDELRLEHDHRVRVADRRGEQPLRVGGRDGTATFTPGVCT